MVGTSGLVICNLLGMKVFKVFGGRAFPSELLNHKAICRIAPGTPGC